jgi:hypothetical protein
MAKGPRIVLWDIETTPNTVAVFKLFGNDYLSHDALLTERYIICAAWKELGAKKVDAVSVLDDAKRFKKSPDDDYHVCSVIHGVLSKADVIIGHNGDRYDIKFTEARLLYHGFSPLPPIQKIDTLKIAKSRFLFNSNRLDYLAKFLGGRGKKPTPKGLWMDVLKNDPKAIRTMVDYNKQDVDELEFVFNKLAPYAKTHVNRQVYGDIGCPRCGSTDFQSRGRAINAAQAYQRFQCKACGGWWRASKSEQTGATARVI